MTEMYLKMLIHLFWNICIWIVLGIVINQRYLIPTQHDSPEQFTSHLNYDYNWTKTTLAKKHKTCKITLSTANFIGKQNKTVRNTNYTNHIKIQTQGTIICLQSNTNIYFKLSYIHVKSTIQIISVSRELASDMYLN